MWLPRGKVNRRGKEWKFGIRREKFYVRMDTNKRSYCIGNYIQHPMSNHNDGKEYKNNIYALYMWASLVSQSVKRLPTMRETWVWSLGQEDHLEKEMATHSSIHAWKIHGPRSLVGYNPRGRKESDTTERLQFTSFIYMIKSLCCTE